MGTAILIVEDEPLLRLAATLFMEDERFSVFEASNADEAIVLLEARDDVRVVFSDVHMPGSMDGVKLAHYIRGRWPPIQLIITSGLAHPRTEDLPIGCEFIGKPYQLAHVADSVRKIIG